MFIGIPPLFRVGSGVSEVLSFAALSSLRIEGLHELRESKSRQQPPLAFAFDIVRLGRRCTNQDHKFLTQWCLDRMVCSYKGRTFSHRRNVH